MSQTWISGIRRVVCAAAIAGMVLMAGAATRGRAGAAQTPTQAQAPTTNVEVEPLTCWWRTDAAAVRLGEPFAVSLTCSLLDADASRVILDESRLDPSVMQLPPFDVLGGRRADDIATPGRRFIQYRYDVRLIAENAFGSDAQLPAVPLSYRIERRAPQGDAVQGRDLTYALTPLTVRVLSLVPNAATDIREAPVVSFSEIAATSFRANVLRTTAIILFLVGTLLALIAIVRWLWARRLARAAPVQTVPLRTVLAAVRRELRDVGQQVPAAGWTPDLVGRALSALRIAAAYASGRAVAQQVSKPDTVPLDGQLRVRPLTGTPMLVSGSATAAGVTGALDDGLRDALAAFTAARFGRDEQATAALDDSLAQGSAAAARLAAHHAWWREALRRLRTRAREARGRVWAR